MSGGQYYQQDWNFQNGFRPQTQQLGAVSFYYRQEAAIRTLEIETEKLKEENKQLREMNAKFVVDKDNYYRAVTTERLELHKKVEDMAIMNNYWSDCYFPLKDKYEKLEDEFKQMEQEKEKWKNIAESIMSPTSQFSSIQPPAASYPLSYPSVPVHPFFVPNHPPPTPTPMPFLRPEQPEELQEPSPIPTPHSAKENDVCQVIGLVAGGQEEQEQEQRFNTVEEAEEFWQSEFADEEVGAFLPGRVIKEYLFNPKEKEVPQGKKRAANAKSFYGNQYPATDKNSIRWDRLSSEERSQWDLMWRDLRARQEAQISKQLIYYNARGKPNLKRKIETIQVKAEPLE